MKYVTINIGGITQSVLEADVPAYLRAGYSVVSDTPAKPVEPVAPVLPVVSDEVPHVEPVAGKAMGKKIS